jgi:superfamily II DNA or RNA helicase
MNYDVMKYCQEFYYKAASKRNKSKSFTKNAVPMKKWLGDEPGMLFMDEAHLIGNPKSRRSECIEMVVPFFEYRYLFSATPWDELAKAYLQLKIIDPILVKGLGYSSWLSDYYNIGTKYSKWDPDLSSLNEAAEAELNEKLYKTYGVMRKKEDILDIPPQYEVPLIRVDMTERQRQIYEQFSNYVVELVAERTENGGEAVRSLLNSFSFAMLAVENPSVILDSKKYEEMPDELREMIFKFKYERDFSKLMALDDVLTEECDEFGNKLLIYYIHPKTMESVYDHYRKRYDVHLIKAGMTYEERDDELRRFRQSKPGSIMIASMNIADTAINLEFVSGTAFLERSWQYVKYDQCKGRTSRATSIEESRIYNFVYNNSLDFLQIENLARKGAVVDGIMKRKSLQPKEWRDVFNGRVFV